MGAGAWEEHRPRQSREPGGLEDTLQTPFPATNGIPKNPSACCRLTAHLREVAVALTARACSHHPALAPAGRDGRARPRGQTDPAPTRCFLCLPRKPWVASSPLLGIR